MFLINKNKLFNLIIYFFVVCNILDPTGDLGLKYISFICLGFSLCFKHPKIDFSKLVFFLILSFFYFFSLLVTQINGGNLLISFTYNMFIPTTILLVIVSEISDKNKILDFIMKSLFYCSLMVILGYFFSYTYKNETIINILKIFAAEYDIREEIRPSTMNIVPKIYFHFTLFLPSAFIYFLFKENYLKSLLIGISILLSLSRVAIVVSFLFLIIYLLDLKNFKNIVKKIILVLVFSMAVIFIVDLFIPNIFIHFLNLSDNSLYTVATRLDQLHAVYNILSENLLYFFFGMGSGTPIYSEYLGIDIYNIEIAPLEILRKYGVLFFIFIFFIIFKIIFQNFKDAKVKCYLLTAILICTFSNPILTAPIFIFIYTLSYSNTLKKINS